MDNDDGIDLNALFERWRFRSVNLTKREHIVLWDVFKREATTELGAYAESIFDGTTVDKVEEFLELRAARILDERYRDFRERDDELAEFVASNPMLSGEEFGSTRWEVDEEGNKLPPSRQYQKIYAPKDDWDRRAGVGCDPRDKCAMREQLRQELERQVIGWVARKRVRAQYEVPVGSDALVDHALSSLIPKRRDGSVDREKLALKWRTCIPTYGAVGGMLARAGVRRSDYSKWRRYKKFRDDETPAQNLVREMTSDLILAP